MFCSTTTKQYTGTSYHIKMLITFKTKKGVCLVFRFSTEKENINLSSCIYIVLCSCLYIYNILYKIKYYIFFYILSRHKLCE